MVRSATVHPHVEFQGEVDRKLFWFTGASPGDVEVLEDEGMVDAMGIKYLFPSRRLSQELLTYFIHICPTSMISIILLASLEQMSTFYMKRASSNRTTPISYKQTRTKTI